MLSKKHNDPFYWKNKLEALESLPGEAIIEKNAMWEKLDNRLHKTSVGNKAIWYWIAAGLLPLIVIVFTIPGNTENNLAKQVSDKKEDRNTPVVVSQPDSKEHVTISVSEPVEKIQPIVTIPVPVRMKERVEDTIKINESIAVSPLPKEQKIELTADSILPADSILTIATVLPFKKKLPLVHINELETYPMQFSAPVNYAESVKLRKNKTNNQNITTTQSRIGFNIKLSSKN